MLVSNILLSCMRNTPWSPLQLETEGGINFLRGILMLPKKLTRSVSNFLAQLPLQVGGWIGAPPMDGHCSAIV
jgi:hypothetical protein